jgi:hypothetical protein
MEKRTETVKKHPLGTRGELPDGRIFRYAFSGAALTAGKLLMGAAGVTAYDMGLAPQAAGAIGDVTVSLKTSASAIAANAFAEGTLYVNAGPGKGSHYRLADTHPANNTASAVPFKIPLRIDDPITVALTTGASKVGLMKNLYADVEIWDVSDVDGPPLGVATNTIADNAYFWLQTWGLAAVLIVTGSSAVPVIGKAVIASGVSGGADGAVEGKNLFGTTDHVIHTNDAHPVVGIGANIAAVTTDYGMIFLTISP